MAEEKAKAPTAKATSTPGPATGGQPSNGLAIAALVVGIIALITGWVVFFGFIVGAAAIVLGVIALKKSPAMKGMSIAGIIMGGIGALWNLVVTVLFVIAIATVGIGGVALSEGLKDANESLAQYNAEAKAQIEAAKDYKKGETARFGQFEVKVDSVQRNYTDSESYFGTPEDGKEYVVVKLTAKNVGAESKYISSFDIKMVSNGVANNSSLLEVDPAFDGGDVQPGASTTGSLVFEVNKDASDLKLQYETFVYDLNGSGLKELTYTLAI